MFTCIYYYNVISVCNKIHFMAAYWYTTITIKWFWKMCEFTVHLIDRLEDDPTIIKFLSKFLSTKLASFHNNAQPNHVNYNY